MLKNQIFETYLQVDVKNLKWKNKNVPPEISFELTGVFKSENSFYYTVDSYSDLNAPGAKATISKIQKCNQDGDFDTSDFFYLVKEIFLPNQTMGSGITLEIFDVTTEKIKEIRKMKLQRLNAL
jgi:hypothetical protein